MHLECLLYMANLEDQTILFSAGTRALKRIMKENNMSESQLRILLVLRALYLQGRYFVPMNRLIDGYCGVNSNSAVYKCMKWLVETGYVERRQINPACTIGDRFTLTGKGLVVAIRYNSLTEVEASHF